MHIKKTSELVAGTQIIEAAVLPNGRCKCVVLGPLQLGRIGQLARIRIEQVVRPHRDLELLRHVVADLQVGDVPGRVLELEKLRRRERIGPNNVRFLTRRRSKTRNVPREDWSDPEQRRDC